MRFVIDKSTLELTLQYLATQPFREVQPLIERLARLPDLGTYEQSLGNKKVTGFHNETKEELKGASS